MHSLRCCCKYLFKRSQETDAPCIGTADNAISILQAKLDHGWVNTARGKTVWMEREGEGEGKVQRSGRAVEIVNTSYMCVSTHTPTDTHSHTT